MSRALLTVPGYIGTQSGYGTRLFYRPGTRFKVCGYLGLVLAVALTATLAVRLALSLWIILWIFLGTISIFLARLLLSRFTGRAQQLVFYHYFITSIIIAVVVSWASRQSILYHVDVTAIGFAAFGAVGRMGCFMVGCCHGRRARFGVCYRERHVTATFPRPFLGVRLFPIQAIEAIWLVLIVIIGSYQIWSEYVPGTAVALFVAAYCPARFFFEFMRWRPRHSYYLGLSEAQWTSVAMMIALFGLERAGMLPFSPWQILIAFVLVIVTIFLVLSHEWRRRKYPLRYTEDVAVSVEISDLCDEEKSHGSS